LDLFLHQERPNFIQNREPPFQNDWGHKRENNKTRILQIWDFRHIAVGGSIRMENFSTWSDRNLTVNILKKFSIRTWQRWKR
jgi:hypothetical protein